jgi:hypothetical protein
VCQAAKQHIKGRAGASISSKVHALPRLIITGIFCVTNLPFVCFWHELPHAQLAWCGSYSLLHSYDTDWMVLDVPVMTQSG